MSANPVARPHSRRSFLAAGTAAAAIGAPVALAVGPTDLDTVDRRWREILESALASARLHAHYDAVEKGLPWWARPGPRYVLGEGLEGFDNPIRSEPAIQTAPKPRRGGMIEIRPDRGALEHLRHVETTLFGAERAQKEFDRRTAEYEARCLAADLEREMLGLPALDAQSEVAAQREIDASAAFQALPPSLEVLAGGLLMMSVALGTNTETLDMAEHQGTVWALEKIRPMLRGAVAASVVDALDHMDREFRHSPLWGYVAEADA